MRRMCLIARTARQPAMRAAGQSQGEVLGAARSLAARLVGRLVQGRAIGLIGDRLEQIDCFDPELPADERQRAQGRVPALLHDIVERLAADSGEVRDLIERLTARLGVVADPEGYAGQFDCQGLVLVFAHRALVPPVLSSI